MSVGCYAFVTHDWDARSYPLDLWLSWSLRQFDQVAVVKYGDFPLPVVDPKLRTKSIDLNPTYERYFNFYTIGKSEAQVLLTTDWRVLLDIDEFMYRPYTGNLDPKVTYPLRYHNLFGSLEFEMAPSIPFPAQQFRVHFGRRQVLGDGANVEGPWAAAPSFDVWHTGACRDPLSLSAKWKVQIEREVSMGYTAHTDRLRFLNGAFPYKRYPEIWPGAKLVKTNTDAVPEILLNNQERFEWWKP